MSFVDSGMCAHWLPCVTQLSRFEMEDALMDAKNSVNPITVLASVH